MTKGICLVVLFTGLAVAAGAQVTVHLTDDVTVTASWHGRLVVLPSQPALRRLGGGSRVRFDPVSRQTRAIALSAEEDVYLTVYNRRNEQVYLGQPPLKVQKRGRGVAYREEYPAAETSWEDSMVTVLPERLLTDDNGRDAQIMRKLWRNRHCWLVTHRGAPRRLRLARQAGLPVGATSLPSG